VDGNVKKLFCIAVLLCSVALFAQETEKPTEGEARFVRNTVDRNIHPISPSTRGGGLAPSTWGFAAHYYGSLYGTGYYPFRTNQTYAGSNSIYGYTFEYGSIGFTNDIRAIYAFDISGLVGEPSPLWSSFMFDTRERPAAGASGSSAWAFINLTTDGSNYALEGLQLFQNNNAANLDIYDAEDFENDDPFANPELAFSGNNPLIGSVSVSTGTVLPLNFDVTAAVRGDGGGGGVPTLGEYGLIAFIALLAAVGVMFIRRNKAA
jgi:hypothetical protein